MNKSLKIDNKLKLTNNNFNISINENFFTNSNKRFEEANNKLIKSIKNFKNINKPYNKNYLDYNYKDILGNNTNEDIKTENSIFNESIKNCNNKNKPNNRKKYLDYKYKDILVSIDEKIKLENKKYNKNKQSFKELKNKTLNQSKCNDEFIYKNGYDVLDIHFKYWI